MAVEGKEVIGSLRAVASILEASPLPTVALDRHGLVRLWNAAAEHLLGWNADEVIGRAPPGIPEEARAVFGAQLERALEGEAVTGIESRHFTRSGEILNVRLGGAPLLDLNGNVVGVVRTLENMSEPALAASALLQSEERFRTIVATANEGIWLVDIHAATMYANDRMARMLGYTLEELLELSVLDCLFPGDEAVAREHVGQNLHGEVEQFDFRFRRKDGEPVQVLACTSPVRSPTGEIVGALGMFTDITDRLAAEEERRELLRREQEARAQAEEAQQRLSLLADASALLASSLDYERTLTSLSRAVVPGMADWCIIHLIDDDGAVRNIAVTHADPSKAELAERLQRSEPHDVSPSTGVFQVLRSARSELVSDASKELLASVAAHHDHLTLMNEMDLRSWMIIPLEARGRVLGAITFATAESERHYASPDVALAEVLARRAALAIDNSQLYREARRVAAELSAILSQMADAVIIVDPSGRVTFINEAARRLGAGRSQSLDAVLARAHVTTPDGMPIPFEEFPIVRAIRERVVVVDARWRVRDDEGMDTVMQGSAVPLLGEHDELLGAVSTFRDVTVQATIEQQKDDFLSAAAHDLRTPLTSVKGLAQVLQRRVARDPDTSPQHILEGLGRIEQNASRMTALINELLDLSRLQMGGTLQLNRRPVDLNALVARAIADHEENAGGQVIRLDTPATPLIGTWDVDRLERVLANLLSNATKYSPDLSEVLVTVAEEAMGIVRCAVVSVHDHGIGIPEQDLPHVFDRFHRGANVGRETLGAGIGLAGSKQIVELHGGTIEVKSEEGSGSTFTVRLPLDSSADGQAPGDQTPA